MCLEIVKAVEAMSKEFEKDLVQARREARAEGFAEGFAEGIIEGTCTEARRMAAALIKKGYSVATIRKISSLPEKELESLCVQRSSARGRSAKRSTAASR